MINKELLEKHMDKLESIIYTVISDSQQYFSCEERRDIAAALESYVYSLDTLQEIHDRC